LFVCNNNQYSISTPRSAALAPKNLSDIALSFGVPGATVDGMDVIAVRDAAQTMVEQARAGLGPGFLECLSGRFSTHSTATRETRSPDQMAALKARCPIEAYARRLTAEGRLSAGERLALEQAVDQQVLEAGRFADASPYPQASDGLRHVR
jgi:TPP-dependent pyruvate/acetoin dehydrogenase alpha subunit